MRSCLVPILSCLTLLICCQAEAETGFSPPRPETPSPSEGDSLSPDLPHGDLARLDRSPSVLTRTLRGNSLVLVYRGPSAESAVRRAVTLWQTCERLGVGHPDLVAVDAQTLAHDPLAWIVHGDRRLDVAVSDTSTDRRCGSFKGTDIEVFRRAQKIGGGVRSCGSLSQNLAHEIGHSLGLPDHPREVRWQNAIMSSLHPRNLFTRKVESFECDAVDALWQTDLEAGTVGVGTRERGPIR